MPASKNLTTRQRTVLQWVADGCPAESDVPSTYKTTARSLEGHNLLKVRRQNKKWTATLTERGKRVLDGVEPLRKPKQRRRSKHETVYISPVYNPPEPHPSTEVELNARAKELLEDLLASKRGWVIRRVMNRSVAKKDWEPISKWVRGSEKNLVPEGKELRLQWQADSWNHDSSVTVIAALLNKNQWVSANFEPLLAGELKVSRYQPLVSRLVQESKMYSSDTKQRAKTLLHVVFTEAKARGWTVTAHETEGHRGYRKLEKVTIDTACRSYTVSVSEHHNNVERPPTKKEIKDYEDSLHWPWNQGKKLPKFYVRKGTGLVSLTVGGTTRNDTKANPTRLNTALQDFFIEMYRDEQWATVLHEHHVLEGERRQRRLIKATELARLHHREEELYNTLLQRSEEWKKRQTIWEYLDALEGVPAASQWLDWCRGYLNEIGLLGEVELPMDNTFDARENRQLVESFERQLPEDETLW